MPGIWKPVLVLIQRKFVTIYSKVCNKVANVHQFLWANETELWNVRAEILMW